MRLLLDTQILLWWLADDPLLPRSAARAIADADTEVVVSAATAWEIALNKASGRLDAPDDLIGALAANEFDALPISAEHAVTAGALPLHHSDPFDRVLIAQAAADGLTLVSVDRRFSDYDVDLLPLS
ncbi:MAG: type II toxin-antitoxin system VapC family toxin [Acidimicrobiales bacterium]